MNPFGAMGKNVVFLGLAIAFFMGFSQMERIKASLGGWLIPAAIALALVVTLWMAKKRGG